MDFINDLYILALIADYGLPVSPYKMNSELMPNNKGGVCSSQELELCNFSLSLFVSENL
jgi:hypothetical protein